MRYEKLDRLDLSLISMKIIDNLKETTLVFSFNSAKFGCILQDLHAFQTVT